MIADETRVHLFLELKGLEDQIIGHIEKIVRVENFDRKRANAAKSKVSAAIQMITGDVDVTKNIPAWEMDSLVNKVKDMARRGRQKLYLEVKEDGSGIVDVITGHEHLFGMEKNKLKNR